MENLSSLRKVEGAFDDGDGSGRGSLVSEIGGCVILCSGA